MADLMFKPEDGKRLPCRAGAGWIGRIDALVRRDERLADALAIGWLYSQPETSRLPA